MREFTFLYQKGLETCEIALKSDAIQNLLESKERYDVILMDQFHNDCLMGVAWKLQAPVIGLSSCALLPYHFERVGMPQHPSYIPSMLVGYDDNMTFIQRFNNWFAVHLVNFLYK